jgi:3-oxoacyl-[acyl-carrier protein] reductase
MRPIALVTGASRRVGIGAAIAERLASAGWDVAITYWRPYDAAQPRGSAAHEVDALVEAIAAHGGRAHAMEADLADADAPAQVFDSVHDTFGAAPTALVLSHCVDIQSGIDDTTVESFDRHYAVNVRASWLLIRELGRRFDAPPTAVAGRIVALTSDDVVGNLPYGATKGALDRVVLAAGAELAARGITANVINPGPNDTGWMTDAVRDQIVAVTPLGRIGRPSDTADLVEFLCSERGAWINRQLLHSDGGFSAT